MHGAYDKLIRINAPFGGNATFSQGCSCLDLSNNVSSIFYYQTILLLKTINAIVKKNAKQK